MKKSFSKGILFSTMALVVLFYTAAYSLAGPTINPGETYEFTGAEGTMEEVSTCTGNNHCVSGSMDSEVYVATILVEGEAQEVMAKITAYNTFAISEGEERLVGAVLNGMIDWEGFLNVGAEDGARAAVDIKIELFDVTDDRTIASQTIHRGSCSSAIDVPCYSHEKGNGGMNLYARLVRGHEYEIRLIAMCSSEFITATDAVCAFIEHDEGFGVEFGDGYIAWSALELSVEGDVYEEIDLIKEEIEQIKADLEALSLEVEQLRIDLDNLKDAFLNHTHVYKTGKGVGHNNTDAYTTPPDSDLVEEGEEEIDPEVIILPNGKTKFPQGRRKKE
jgi:hypothetical protein